MGPIERTILDQFKALLGRRAPIHKVILFGSRARGEAEADSDLDVVVILEGDVDAALKDYVSDCAWAAGFDHGIVVVPLVYSQREWEEGPERSSLLAQAVAADGVLV
jgi:uncharacterized protein